MGLISSSALPGRGVNSANNITNNLPPLLFHQVHGDNVRILRDGALARRAESFCKGIVFSARPVKVSERIYLKFADVSDNWSGVLRFGFTSNDPSTLRYGLPKYACPDLTNKPGYWAKALSERFCEKDFILFYYVNSAGEVHFGINGEEKGIFFTGVETRGPLWAMLDIYGNSTAVEFLDPRQHLNNARRSVHYHSSTADDPARYVASQMSAMSIHQPQHVHVQPAPPQPPPSCAVDSAPPPLRYQHPSAKFSPLPFHRTRGRNVRLSNDRCIASRNEAEFCHGYVFTGRPIQLGERIVVQILATEPMYLGALALGLTSCDPASLSPSDLPDDSDQLLDRPEYWVVNKDVAGGPQRGDELAFCITATGEVQMSKNGSPPISLMHIDQSQTLWAFLDIYGSTQKIRILGSALVHSSQGCSPPRALPTQNSSIGVASNVVERCRQPPVTVTTAPGVGGGTVLVVNLPPSTPGYQASPPPIPPPHISYSPTYIEPVSSSSYSTMEPATDDGVRQWAENNAVIMAATAAAAANSQTPSDCSVCYERTIDSVLYTCGHMCMCFECSVQLWRRPDGGHCPLCRAVIRDVIRTFKS